MRIARLFAALLASLVPAALARSSTGDKVLVVMEPGLKAEDYSLFFNNLRSRGYELFFRAPNEKVPTTMTYDIPQFSHIIMFTPTTKNSELDVSPQALFTLMRENPFTNILVTLSPKRTAMSDFAAEFAIGLPPPNTPLISHFPARSSPHTQLTIEAPSKAHPLLTKNLPPILFEGQAHMLGDNPLLFPILNAPAESFSTDGTEDRRADAVVEAADKGGEGLWAGSKMSVVSGFQATNGARVAFVGGVKLFSDEFAKAEVAPGKRSGNGQLAQDIAAWTFQETLVYKIERATHHLESDETRTEQERYTINDRVTFTMEISQFDPIKNTYIPKSNIDDLQLEFTMLDPHIRTAIPAVADKPGTYSVTFRAPDRHGVFKFVVNHKRKGLTPLQVAMPVAVVPPRHDGYPRFLSAAWPYYIGAISTSVGFVFFCIVYLGAESATERKRKEKGKNKVE